MLSAYYLMRLFQEAGPPRRRDQPRLRLGRRDRRRRAREPATSPGIHFTGSTRRLQRDVAHRRRPRWSSYRNYPRIVGETGGKDFIVAHPSANVDALATAIVRGSFEYQGQKCSAASRVYAPSNLWPQLRERLQEEVATIKVGDVSDFGNFMGAVIDSASFATQAAAIEEAKRARRDRDRRRRRLRRLARLLRRADRDRDDATRTSGSCATSCSGRS